MTTADWGDIYKELGATPVINATGSVTMLGGSTPIPEVREAMARADGAYIPLMDLQEKAGAAIARMVDVPAAYITSGAGSALMLATAAAMAGDDDDRIQQLPNTDGMKNEILIQTRQRYWYDRCLELAGAKLVMFGSEERTTAEDLENAIGHNTAAVHYYAVEQEHDPDAVVPGGNHRHRPCPRRVGDGGRRRTDLPAGKLRQIREDGRGFPVHRRKIYGRAPIHRVGVGAPPK